MIVNRRDLRRRVRALRPGPGKKQPPPGEIMAGLDEIVSFARQSGHRVLPVALVCHSAHLGGAGDHEGAVAAAEEAVGLLEPLAARQPARYGPHLLVARFTLAVAYYRHGRLADAVPALERHLRMAELAPGSRERELKRSLRLLVIAQLRLARPAEAVPHAERLVALVRSDRLPEVELATVLSVRSSCRLLAGVPDAGGAAESVTILCRAVAGSSDKKHAAALSRAVRLLDAAFGRASHVDVLELQRWFTIRKHHTDLREWLIDLEKNGLYLGRLVELAMRSLAMSGRRYDARRAGMGALTILWFHAELTAETRAAAARVLEYLGTL